MPMEAIASIAKRLGVTEADVVGVLSYYPDLHTAPRGRHIVPALYGGSLRGERVVAIAYRAVPQARYETGRDLGGRAVYFWNGSIVSAIAEWF